MRCEHVRHLIPEWLDGELDAGESREIKNHIDKCTSCRKEADFWESVGTSLREEAVGIKAPAGFAQDVAAQLAEGPGRKSAGFLSGWKRSIAAAAAFMLVAAGSLGAFLNWEDNTGSNVAQNNDKPAIHSPDKNNGQGLNIPQMNSQDKDDEDIVINNNESQDQDPGEAENQQNTQPEENTGSNKDSTGTEGSNPGDTSDPDKPGDGEDAKDSSSSDNDNDDVEETNQAERVLLSTDKDRISERTLVRVKVEDIAAAHEKAVDYIKNSGARFEMITKENSQETIKITAGTEELLGNLKELGQVTSTDRQEDDITGEYNNKVEQYRTLDAEIESIDDPDEKEAIQVKMNTIMDQLEKWKQQTTTRIIVLWMQD
ncbi:MAG: zf-HC2 domain-containing protein [Clostridiales bacterium]|nr:zf-HC2 domain-containing protein [Clostridiales bacterium]MCF8023377.1 zf-HC2 domain-containing protein [Clostridiales bacterium]